MSSQALAAGHNAASGGEDHSHDDIACAACVVAMQQTVIEPDLKLVIPFSHPVRVEWDDFTNKTAPRSFDGRAPPPRGPPTH